MRGWFHDQASSLTVRAALRPENSTRSRRGRPSCMGRPGKDLHQAWRRADPVGRAADRAPRAYSFAARIRLHAEPRCTRPVQPFGPTRQAWRGDDRIRSDPRRMNIRAAQSSIMGILEPASAALINGPSPRGCPSARAGSHFRGPDASVAPGEMGANLQQRAPEAALEPGEPGHAIYWLNRPFLPCFPPSSAIP